EAHGAPFSTGLTSEIGRRDDNTNPQALKNSCPAGLPVRRAAKGKGTGLSADPPFFVRVWFGLLGRLRNRENRDEGAALESLAERYTALGNREDGMVTAHQDAFARPPLGATLTHDDVARNGGLATKELHAKATT